MASRYLKLKALTLLAACVPSSFSLAPSNTPNTTLPSPRPLRTDIPNFPAALQPALAYELSTYTNGSVYTDPFYSVPANSSHLPPGTLLKSEAAIPYLYELPPATSLSRIIYQSLDLRGNTVPVSAYVLFPYVPRRNSDGTLQVVAWAHGTSGLYPESGPSHLRNLWQHYIAPFPLALQGYVVVATDYAGLGVPQDADGNEIRHEYLAAPAAANDVLFAVQAARAAFPELGERFVALGHSEGGGAVWKVAEKMRESTGLMDGYLGAVAVAPVTRIMDLLSVNNPVYELISVARMDTIKRWFPKFHRKSVLTEEAQQLWAICKASGALLSTLMACMATNNLLKDGWDDNEFVKEYDDLVAPGGKAIKGPFLVLQGEADPIMTMNATTSAMDRTVDVSHGESIEYVTMANVTHVPSMFASQGRWLDWIKTRFDGEKSVEGHTRQQVAGYRPVKDTAPELTWFLGYATAFWEVP